MIPINCADVDIDGEGVDEEQVTEWARRAPMYALVALGQDIDVTVDTAAEVAADD